MPGKEVPHVRQYGLPLYGVAWPEGHHIYLAGGGGSAASGIKNKLLWSKYMNGVLSSQVGEFKFDIDCPVKMLLVQATTAKPTLLIAMGSGNLKRFDITQSSGTAKVYEQTSSFQEKLVQVNPEGREVKCLSYDRLNHLVAVGFKDGFLRVLEWPSMKLRLDLSGDVKLRDTVQDLDFLPSSKSPVVVAACQDGSCEMWDLQKGKVIVRMERPKGQMRDTENIEVSTANNTGFLALGRGMKGASFSRVRMAREGAPRMFALMNCSAGPPQITVWGPLGPKDILEMKEGRTYPKLLKRCKVHHDPTMRGCCFEISGNGRYLAVGTTEGTVLVFTSEPLALVRKVDKAHMVFTTALSFSPDDAQVVSIGADSGAHVMEIMPKSSSSLVRYLLLLLLVLAMALTHIASLRDEELRSKLIAVQQATMEYVRTAWQSYQTAMQRGTQKTIQYTAQPDADEL